jgi:ribosome-associated heat shock protein Hsp15
MSADAEPVRVDQWLWAARFFKTRTLARQAVDAGRVRVADAACKPARLLRLGDRISVRRGDELFEIEVAGLSDRRGPAAVAQTLYVETEAARVRRLAELAQRKAERAGFKPPESKPDKRARRLIRALGDIEAM